MVNGITNTDDTNKKKTIRDFISNGEFIQWTPNYSCTTNYLCEITLHEITVLYQYHGQRGYDYFTYQTSYTTIDICLVISNGLYIKYGFWGKPNGIKNFNKNGDKFATFTLTHDNTLRVKYNFPEWIQKVNEIAKTLFFQHITTSNKTINIK